MTYRLLLSESFCTLFEKNIIVTLELAQLWDELNVNKNGSKSSWAQRSPFRNVKLTVLARAG